MFDIAPGKAGENGGTATPGGSLAIKGLEKLVGKEATEGTKFDPATHKIVVTDGDGVLHEVSPEVFIEEAIKAGQIDGKGLTSSSIVVGPNGAKALLHDVNIEVKAGGAEGEVLVTQAKKDKDGNPLKDDAGNVIYETVWKAANDLGNTVKSGEGVAVLTDPTTGTNTVNLGGNLTKPAVLDLTDAEGKKVGDLAIKGLEDKSKIADVSKDNNVVIADADGVLSQVSAEALVEDAIKGGAIEGKGLTSKSIVVTGGEAALLKDVLIEFKGGSKPGQILETTGGGTTPKTNADGNIVDKDGNELKDKDGNSIPEKEISKVKPEDKDKVVYEGGETQWVDGKGITSKGSTIAITGKDVTTSLLKDVNLEIQAGSTSGQVLVTYVPVLGEPVTNANGEILDKSGNPIVGNDGKPATNLTDVPESKKGDVLVHDAESVKGGSESKWVTPEQLGNTVTASNGLQKDADNDIKLGGNITEKTVLDVTDAAGSLAITGLEAPKVDATTNKAPKTKNVVIDPATGELHAVDNKQVTGIINIDGTTTGGNVTIQEGDEKNYYSQNQEEVVIEVTLGNKDTNLLLPTPTGAEGQTISIKIVNTNEEHTGYLNIKAPTKKEGSAIGTLAYGAMPHQGWIVKSNGTNWVVVARM